MNSYQLVRKLSLQLSAITTAFIFACSLAFAGDGPVQGGGGGGGGGVGVGIDIGTVFNVLKNIKKGEKCDPKVAEEAAKTCSQSSNPSSQNPGEVTAYKNCVKKACEVSKPAVIVVEPKKEDKDKKCEGEVANGAHYAYQHGAGKGMTEDAYVKEQCATRVASINKNFKTHSARRTYKPQGQTCKVNGDFEAGGFASWTGADNGIYPTLVSSSSSTNPLRRGAPDWTKIPNLGINSGAIDSDNTHQTIVNAGNDWSVGALLQQLPPTGGTNAARIGNMVNRITSTPTADPMLGEELLAKSFKVTPADTVVNFSYAVLLQNPNGHSATLQPSFSVIVRDSSGNDITNNITGGRVHLSTGVNPNELVADATQPFFMTLVPTTKLQEQLFGPDPQGNLNTMLYKDWSCAQINLADMVGQDVTVEFITHDCGLGGHSGYAYIDDFCGTCSIKSNEGWLELAQSDKCGVGKVCVDVGIPNKKGSVGQATVSLDIWQNGVLVKTLTSPVLTANGQYCFTIDPAAISGLDLTKGFDYNATATMQSGSIILPVKTIGVPKDGTQSGQNNDYKSQCDASLACGTAAGQLACPLCDCLGNAVPVCGTPGQPPCPKCGQAGQPSCQVCGQAGQPLCVTCDVPPTNGNGTPKKSTLPKSYPPSSTILK
jgi:hypothetical protein